MKDSQKKSKELPTSSQAHEALIRTAHHLARVLRAFVRYQKVAAVLPNVDGGSDTMDAMTEAVSVHLQELYCETKDELERAFARKLQETNHPVLLRLLDYFYARSNSWTILPGDLTDLMVGVKRRNLYAAMTRAEQNEVGQLVHELRQRDPAIDAMKDASTALDAALASRERRWLTLSPEAFEAAQKTYAPPAALPGIPAVSRDENEQVRNTRRRIGK